MSYLSDEGETEKKKFVEKHLGKTTFVAGLLVILVSVYSEYVIPGLNLVSGALLVYGVPILVTGLIWGRTIISKALRHIRTALKYGLGYFGFFTVLGLAAGFLILFVLAIVDRQRLVSCTSRILFCRYLQNLPRLWLAFLSW